MIEPYIFQPTCDKAEFVDEQILYDRAMHFQPISDKAEFVDEQIQTNPL